MNNDLSAHYVDIYFSVCQIRTKLYYADRHDIVHIMLTVKRQCSYVESSVPSHLLSHILFIIFFMEGDDFTIAKVLRNSTM